jgi:fatty acid desaturase
MITIDRKIWTTQAEYAKKLRPLMPEAAFAPDFSKVWILLMNFAILLTGWGIADRLDQWHWYYLWLYLPITLMMGNSIMVLSFSIHYLLHSSVTKRPFLRQGIGFLGFVMLWMPPTLWKAVHNREHHSKTNSLHDPDRNYLDDQPKNWGKWFQHLIVPSSEVTSIGLLVGMTSAWGLHTFRNLSSVLLFNNGQVQYTPASFKVSPKERRTIALELLIMAAFHLSVLIYLQFDPIKLILSYFLPIWIGYAGIMFYIYTNHMLCRMTSVNDPLMNSVSLRVPKIFDRLHLNFSYHTEHHIFPSVSSDYYPLVQTLLQTHYPDRLNLLDAGTAWQLMLQTPRHYKDENTFVDWAGEKSVVCPLSNQDGCVD